MEHNQHNTTTEKVSGHNRHHDHTEMDHTAHEKHMDMGVPADQRTSMNQEGHAEHGSHQMEMSHNEHAGHGADHTGHEQMFRQRFRSRYCCTALQSKGG